MRPLISHTCTLYYLLHFLPTEKIQQIINTIKEHNTIYISHQQKKTPPPSQKNRTRRENRTYICGLGASVGCERISEHSTRRDESHRYRFDSLFGFVCLSFLLSIFSFILLLKHIPQSVPKSHLFQP